MFRTGIYSINQLLELRLKDIFLKEKNISIALYKKLAQLDDDELFEKYSAIVLNRFNSSGNIIKRTYSERFTSFDEMAIDVIKNHKSNCIRIHDIAISDGRASCYFLEKVLENYNDFEYNASDISLSYNVFQKKNDSRTYIVTDEHRNIIEITSPPFVWNFARGEGSFYILNNLIKKRYYKKCFGLLNDNSLILIDRIVLINRCFQKLMDKSNKIKVFNYNILESTLMKVDIIRAMNILHYGYLNKDQLNKALLNIHQSLDSDGLFIEGSNEDAGSEVEGAIFKKTNDSFELLSAAKNPSRILNQVLKFRAY
jgi:chemotaxis methyl-accepting protein methylase